MDAIEKRARDLLAAQFNAEGRERFERGQAVVITTASALNAIEGALSVPLSWRPIAEAPEDGTRLMLWDSVSKRPVFGSWRGDNHKITHFAAEPAGPEVA